MFNSSPTEEISQEDSSNSKIMSPDIKNEELKKLFRLWRDDTGNPFIDLSNKYLVNFIKKLDDEKNKNNLKKNDKSHYFNYVHHEIDKELSKFGPEDSLPNTQEEYRVALQIFKMVLDEKDLVSSNEKTTQKAFSTVTTIKDIFSAIKGSGTTKDAASTLKDSGLKLGRNIL